MKLKHRLLAIGGVLAMAAMTTAADAAILIQGKGKWSDDTLSSTYTKAGKRFSFSFEIGDLVDGQKYYDVSNFTYTLGKKVFADVPSPTGLFFYNAKKGGLFDLYFDDFTVQFEGDSFLKAGAFKDLPFKSKFDIYMDGGSAPTPVFAPLSFSIYAASGRLTATSIAAIPEPATWAMMGLGFAAVGGALRSRRRVQTRVVFA